jgi:ATP-dependent protease ClpP protease subunit
VSLIKIPGWICGVLLFWAFFQLPSGSGDVASRQTLSVSEEPSRIVLGWSGPVREPMSERVAAALDRYKADQRRLVLILNSPGGSIEHGRRVVAAIRARGRAIDTLVQKAGVCASMCVPIFLAGTKRMADPEALFSRAVKAIETQATDDFFRNDIGIRGINMVWLARMREKISGRDVWMSGQQLADEGSGIVDHLIRTPAP